jgi:hypothetical protein
MGGGRGGENLTQDFVADQIRQHRAAQNGGRGGGLQGELDRAWRPSRFPI